MNPPGSTTELWGRVSTKARPQRAESGARGSYAVRRTGARAYAHSRASAPPTASRGYGPDAWTTWLWTQRGPSMHVKLVFSLSPPFGIELATRTRGAYVARCSIRAAPAGLPTDPPLSNRPDRALKEKWCFQDVRAKLDSVARNTQTAPQPPPRGGRAVFTAGLPSFHVSASLWTPLIDTCTE